MSSLAGEAIEIAVLRVRVGGADNGTINLHEGRTNLWTELYLNSSNAPPPVLLLDSASGTFTIGSWLEFYVTDGISSTGSTNSILSIPASTDGIVVSSSEGNRFSAIDHQHGTGRRCRLKTAVWKRQTM